MSRLPLSLISVAIAIATGALVCASSRPRGGTQATASSAAASAPPAPAAPTLADAMAKLNAGDAPGAVAIASEVTSRDPTNARAWRVLGVADIRAKDGAGAVAALQRALTIEPDAPPALYNLGVAYVLTGDTNAAFAALARAKATRKLDMSQIDTDADLASLAHDPRFAALRPVPADFANPFVEPVAILHEWDGEAAGDQFGWIARNIGDVDGDHVPDIVTSAPTKNIGGAGAGRVYVFSTKTGRKLWSVDGHPGDQLGQGIEAAGDTNHDGVPDVIASAPGGGYATVYSGRDGRVLFTMKGEHAGDGFGAHVAGIGDVNHDGFDDVIVGAPANGAAGTSAGRAYIYSGKDGALLLTLTGEHAGDRFGASVTGSTSAGVTTIVVGAPGAGPTKHGRAYVYHGLAATPAFTVDADDTGNALAGMFVSVPGDLDRDGVPDVYISDWSNSAKGPSTGRVYVYSGKDGHRLFTLTGETAGDGFGSSPAVAGDVDGDGYPDLIVGAWQYAGAATSGGRAYLYSGKDGHLMKTFTCRIPGDTFGFDAVAMGDVDGDGTIDFLITSGWSGIHGFHSGRVFIISSGITAHRTTAGR